MLHQEMIEEQGIEKNPVNYPAHLFLASLGKTVLRPGGIRATRRIIKDCGINEKTRVLEVAPNMGTTAIYLAKTYGCQVVGVDLHQPSLEKAMKNVQDAGFEDKVTFLKGDARSLPFEDESFDVVINEAMLTMLPNKEKEKAIAEYHRVLRPGGKLGTHDLTFKQTPPDYLVQMLQMKIKTGASPLVVDQWKELYERSPFSQFDLQLGDMCLLTLEGLLVDEGWENTINILQNAMKSEMMRDRFYMLTSFFQENQHVFGHCTTVATK